jgi:hypothetical protein
VEATCTTLTDRSRDRAIGAARTHRCSPRCTTIEFPINITKQLHATWGESWRIFAPEWKLWVHDATFQVFYTGHFTAAPTSSGTATSAYSNGDFPGKVRFCNG